VNYLYNKITNHLRKKLKRTLKGGQTFLPCSQTEKNVKIFRLGKGDKDE
jgi:hypothetical protein